MLKYYKLFFKYFAKGYRKYIPVVIFGAAIAGVFEIIGIMLLFPFIQILINPEVLDRHAWLIRIFQFIKMNTPLRQAGVIGVVILVIFISWILVMRKLILQ